MKVCICCGVSLENVYFVCSECQGRLVIEAEIINLPLSSFMRYEARKAGWHTINEFRLFNASIKGIPLIQKWFSHR